MNLTKKVIDIDSKYCMYFDMESVLEYKDQGKSFVEGYAKLMKFDDEEIINFIGATLRDKENNNKPVGCNFIRNNNPLQFLIQYGVLAITLICDGFENDSNEDVKKKTI